MLSKTDPPTTRLGFPSRQTMGATAVAPQPSAKRAMREMLNKVPEVTLYFWLIKVMATTVGETAADWVIETFGLSLARTTWIALGVLAAILIAQFRSRKYVPATYWLAVVAISIVGTLITDYFTDDLGVSLWVSTGAFATALAASFAIWYSSERTLSIHSIFTSKREAFYWLTILFTFALGTAAGDLLAETVALGYLPSALLFAGGIAAIAAAWHFLELDGVLAFWLAYILTRPLGASFGDYLSQPADAGGLNLGTTATSFIFLGAILALVSFLTVTKKDLGTTIVELDAAA